MLTKQTRMTALFLTVVLVLVSFGSAFAVTAEAAWTDGVKGQYTVVDAVPAGSVLIGKTPTQDNTTTAWVASEAGGTGATAVVNDGALALTDPSQVACFGGCWGPKHYGFTYDMGGKYEFNSFLIGSNYSNGQQMYWVKIYVGNDLSTLYADTNLVAELKGITRSEKNVVVRVGEGETATGRYVGFGCYSSADSIPDNNGQNYYYYGNLYLAELGAYGAEISDWTAGVQGEYQVVTSVPANSLIAGKTPTKDATETAWTAKSDGGAPEVMTDGKLASSQVSELAMFENCWGPKHYGFTYDMGAVCTVDSFLIGGDYGNGQQQYWVKVYVSDTLSTLYSDTSLVAEVKGMTRAEKNILVRLGEGITAEGRYVGFGCYSSPDGVKDNNNQNYWYYGTLRLGELAVYGKAPGGEDSGDEDALLMVSVGDSITEGFHFTNASSSDSAYFENCYAKLVVDNLNNNTSGIKYTLYNAGISAAAVVGSADVDSNDGLQSWMNNTRKTDKIRKCDILTVMLGTNDAPGWAVRAYAYKSKYKAIVDAYRALNPEVEVYILTSPYTMCLGYTDTMENKVIPAQKELAYELDAYLIDVYAATKAEMLKNGEEAIIDHIDVVKGIRLHPDEAGHAFIADVVTQGMAAKAKATQPAAPDYEITAGNAAAKIPAVSENLLKTATLKTGNGGESLAALFDGKISGIHTTVNDGSEKHAFSSVDYTPEEKNTVPASTGWAKFSFDLGAVYGITDLVVGGSGNDSADVGGIDNKNVRYIEMYLSDEESTLFNAGNRALTFCNDVPAVLGAAVKLPAKTYGRYVGFCTSAGTDSQLRLSELGVYGAEKGEWSEGIKGEYKVVSSVPAGSLIAGKVPTKDTSADLWNASATGGTAAVMTDGNLAVSELGELAFFEGCWGPKHYGFTYDMGVSCTVDSLLIGGDYGNGQQQYWVKMYVSDTLSTLYSDTNLVAEVKGMTRAEKNILVRLGEGITAEGRYVGFGCYSSPDGVKDNNNQNYMYYGTLRLGELAVYGEAPEYAESLDSLGGQLRDSLAADDAGIRFGFHLDCTGVSKDAVTHARIFATQGEDAATVQSHGITQTLVDFGAVVTNREDIPAELLTLEAVNGGNVQAVSAQKVYDLDATGVVYTVAVTGISRRYADRILTAVPYVTFREGETTVTEYGQALSRSVLQLQGTAEANACVTGAVVSELSAVPTGENLLQGLEATSYTGTVVKFGEHDLSMLTDGQWQGLNVQARYLTDENGNATADCVATNVGDTEAAIRTTGDITETGIDGFIASSLTFDLGAVTSIGSFAYGNPDCLEDAWIGKGNPVGSDRINHPENYRTKSFRLHLGDFYISNDRATLYTENNKVVAWDYLRNGACHRSQSCSPLNCLYTLDTPVSGRYVGFKFYEAEENGWGWWYLTRLTELAVYAGTGAVEGAETKGFSAAPTADNRLSGLVPTDADGRTPAHRSNTLDTLTDATWQGIQAAVSYQTDENGKITASPVTTNVEDTAVTLTAQEDTTATAKAGKKAITLVYDLGNRVQVSAFSVGNAAKLAELTLPVGSTLPELYQNGAACMVRNGRAHMGDFYVAEDAAGLFTAESRCTAWDFLPSDGNAYQSASPLNVSFSLCKPAVGRYVGFKFYVDSLWTGSETLMLAELAVYGTDYEPWHLEIGDASAMDTSVLNPLSCTGGSILIDTDIGADCDDAGALAVAFALMKQHSYSLAGVVNSTSCVYGNGAIDAIASYYGYSLEKTGIYDYTSFHPNDTRFNQYLTEHMTTHRSAMVSSTQYYREVLTAAEDASVVLVTLGGFNAVADFLKEEPALFAQKVRLVVSMGGALNGLENHPYGKEYNILLDVDSASYFAENCPCPLIYDTWELTANSVYSGFTSMDWNNPVAVSFYKLMDGELLRSSCDISAVQVAIEGLTDQYELSAAGTMSFSDDGISTFTESPDGNHYYLKKLRSNRYIGLYLSSIMQAEP